MEVCANANKVEVDIEHLKMVKTKTNNMKKVTTIIILSIAVPSLFAQKTAIPHLEKNGNTTQLIVQGKPFLILGGELHNSSTSGADYMRPVWEQMKKKNLNTVIAP